MKNFLDGKSTIRKSEFFADLIGLVLIVFIIGGLFGAPIFI